MEGDEPAKSPTLLREAGDARIQQMNNDIVSLLRIPRPEQPIGSFRGIGMYTHIGARSFEPNARSASLDPVFLPIGGPRRVTRDVQLEARVSPEVRQVWSELQNAITTEEQLLGQSSLSIERLKDRYGVSNKSVTMPNQQEQSNSSQSRQKRGIDLVNGTDHGGCIDGDGERGRSGTMSNTYDPERDPRLQFKRPRQD